MLKSIKIRYVLCIFAVFLLYGCKTRQVVVTEYRDRWHTDTITRTDSVWQSRLVYVEGDTVRDIQVKEVIRYRDRVVMDIQHDSVPYIVEVTKEVRRRSNYDRFCSFSLWFIIVCLVIVVAVRFYLKRRI